MVNYYKQFESVRERDNLRGKQFSLDEFEQNIRRIFGFGTRKTVSRWLNNFQDAGYIDVTKSSDGIWFVEVK